MQTDSAPPSSLNGFAEPSRAQAPLGIAPWIMGNKDLREMDAGVMDPSGRSLTSGGRICGIIATVLLALSIVVVVLMVALGVLGAAVASP